MSHTLRPSPRRLRQIKLRERTGWGVHGGVLRENPYARSLRFEPLEDRALLSVGFQNHHIVLPVGAATPGCGPAQLAPLAVTPPGTAKTPHQIRMAYGLEDSLGNPLVTLGGVVGDGTGQTVAIVDAYDDPALLSGTDPNFNTSDLHVFDTYYGLADPAHFLKLNQTGGTSYPAANSDWATEEALDVEWVHVFAPGANIVLFEANSNSDADLMATVNEARTWAGVAGVPPVSVVSMSWGSTGSEPQSDETTYDSYFTTPSGHVGMTFLASTGDSGAPGGYPAFSPNVVAVGGTSLYLNADNSYQSESGWSDSGGGQSQYETEPGYQSGVQSSGMRQIPDVSFDADPNTGVAVLDSYGYGGWVQVGGTSVSSPCWAGLVSVADQLRATQGIGSLDGISQTLPTLYTLPSADFHDITSGNNGYPAHAGYDMVTGIGSPQTAALVPDLASFQAPNLTVAKAHSGNFTQGDVGDTYMITVSNGGSAATSGTVSLVDSLPAGLTATAFSGQGWTTNLDTLTATRSDPLAAGASYPVLTVTVNVAADAAANLTNVATVSGGGELYTGDDTASDPTTVVQLIDLAVTKTHSGNFRQGDVGDTYTITVSNLGCQSSSGLVTVVDALPAWLTATAFSGQGWTTNLGTLTATRSDPLAAGAELSGAGASP